MYDRVLFPTDASDAADVATDHAIELARRFDAPLAALYVVDTPSIQATDAYATSNFESTYEALEAAGLPRGRGRPGGGRRRLPGAGVDAETIVAEGAPASTIVDEAREGDVIVMGTHGRSGLDRYLIGSTTEKVVRTAHVPVLTVPISDEA